MTDSGIVVIGDGTNTTVDANVVYHIYRTTCMLSSEQGRTPVDVSSLAQPLRPQCPLVPTTVVPPEIKPVHRGIEASRTSIRTRAVVIGGRLKRPMPKIEFFLHTETLGNPLTIPAMLINRGPQVNSDARDRNAKGHKRLHTRNVDGQFRFEIQNKNSGFEGLGKTHYGDESAIMGDDEQELYEGDPDSNNDCKETPNDPDIQIRYYP